MKIEVDLPKIVLVHDYHDFDDMVNEIDTVLDPNPKIKVKELGFEGHFYVGVVYAKKLPLRSWIKKELEKRVINLQ